MEQNQVRICLRTGIQQRCWQAALCLRRVRWKRADFMYRLGFPVASNLFGLTTPPLTLYVKPYQSQTLHSEPQALNPNL